MQIPTGNQKRVDFYGNAKDGNFIELVDERGYTVYSRMLTETERELLVDTLTRKDNGRSV